MSPFLGDDDNETLNNILACQWNFEEEEFKDISDEAKDFITRLLVKSKSWRMSATESLRHPWLSDQSLHYQLNQKVVFDTAFFLSLYCWLANVAVLPDLIRENIYTCLPDISAISSLAFQLYQANVVKNA